MNTNQFRLSVRQQAKLSTIKDCDEVVVTPGSGVHVEVGDIKLQLPLAPKHHLTRHARLGAGTGEEHWSYTQCINRFCTLVVMCIYNLHKTIVHNSDGIEMILLLHLVISVKKCCLFIDQNCYLVNFNFRHF